MEFMTVSKTLQCEFYSVLKDNLSALSVTYFPPGLSNIYDFFFKARRALKTCAFKCVFIDSQLTDFFLQNLNIVV